MSLSTARFLFSHFCGSIEKTNDQQLKEEGPYPHWAPSWWLCCSSKLEKSRDRSTEQQPEWEAALPTIQAPCVLLGVRQLLGQGPPQLGSWLTSVPNPLPFPRGIANRPQGPDKPEFVGGFPEEAAELPREEGG